ncbi:TetR/AcrR family transcriptional regulator [Spartinivicinus poritis]|uniref:TetR/AcrR family transcriptional regulator n=1 Tax=Spartinivicinus poritis TaxID=2994640 RepID=A0ABT5UFK1_9GAMM|nr:TetR/AcrR family transcriptional regulator [Spartinivicinus sp. A2-2]MDE1465157.1 TetR/AcrR family transcriptional regulator [Spartinivicinus sp. A2-2]
MKTRERILSTSLQLFNDFGEPNITTIDISNEMEISPGNLYYHFQGKDAIILELYLRFEHDLIELLESPSRNKLAVDDYWLYLHIIFETIQNYRFLYRDLSNLLAKYKKIQARFNRLISRKKQMFIEICQSLKRSDLLMATEEEIEALADNAVVIATFWLNYQVMRHKNAYDSSYISQGIYQVMTLIAPYLVAEQKVHVQTISRMYKEKGNFLQD